MNNKNPLYTNILKLNREGFTLVELLTAVGILLLLLTIVLVAVNPQKHFMETSNVKRRNDVIAILNAVQQYAIDNNGTMPSGITSTSQNIASGDLDLCDDLVTKYIAGMPFDPNTGDYTDCNDYDTKYKIYKASDNRITVEAPDAQGGVTIKVTR